MAAVVAMLAVFAVNGYAVPKVCQKAEQIAGVLDQVLGKMPAKKYIDEEFVADGFVKLEKSNEGYKLAVTENGKTAETFELGGIIFSHERTGGMKFYEDGQPPCFPLLMTSAGVWIYSCADKWEVFTSNALELWEITKPRMYRVLNKMLGEKTPAAIVRGGAETDGFATLDSINEATYLFTIEESGRDSLQIELSHPYESDNIIWFQEHLLTPVIVIYPDETNPKKQIKVIY
ncbi:MAG: hypothetical protein NTW04_05080 [Elusimicrobia bacterium]|nr:hypothetical protein [Elusimicrobiota bacterium]